MVQITMDDQGNIVAWATDTHDKIAFEGYNAIVAEKDKQLADKDAEIERLRAALQFYADQQTYGMQGGSTQRIFNDSGEVAKRALAGGEE